MAAAKVGGILANSTYPADFLRENLAIQINVVDAAFRHGVRKLQFLGSSCIYPKLAPQPLKEEYLLSGSLEPTNEWYAVAKIAGIKLCEAFRLQHGFNAISLMPTNLYGPGDNFDLQTSHVLPALIRKFHDAKGTGADTVTLWGIGHEISVADLAALIARVVGFRGRCVFDTAKPDGTPRKLMDSSRLMAIGWRPGIEFEGAYS